MSQLKDISIVGGSGQAGSHIVDALFESNKFIVTAITRDDSSSTFPTTVKVQRGDYSLSDFLISALQGQDALIIILAATAPKHVQSHLIEAAAAAGVPWIFPCEFGPDTGNPLMVNSVPILASKKQYRDQIQELGKSSWIGFINGLWFDFSLAGGFFDLKIRNRTARLYNDGTTKLSTTTLPQVGRAVAKLLELPTSALEQYKNNFVYINSFNVSQIDMLRALEKATGTTEKDWEVTKIPVNTAIAQGREEVAKGNRRGMIDVLYGINFKPGMGGCFEKKIANDVLDLHGERLEDVVAGILRQVEMS